MCCLFLTLVTLGPRVAGVLWWLFSPARFTGVFSSILFPILGLIFVPWTTIMYVLVASGGLSGLDWLFLGLAFVIDLTSYGGSAYKGSEAL